MYTTSTATRMTGVPPTTILGLEKRGVIGPFQRDSIGRRLLTDDDIEALKVYAAERLAKRDAA